MIIYLLFLLDISDLFILVNVINNKDNSNSSDDDNDNSALFFFLYFSFIIRILFTINNSK